MEQTDRKVPRAKAVVHPPMHYRFIDIVFSLSFLFHPFRSYFCRAVAVSPELRPF